MYHMFICCVFSIFAVTAAAAADAADRTEKLPLLGVVLLKRNHHTKNQPDPIINVATAPFLGFWVPRPQMCHKITPPLYVCKLLFESTAKTYNDKVKMETLNWQKCKNDANLYRNCAFENMKIS